MTRGELWFRSAMVIVLLGMCQAAAWRVRADEVEIQSAIDDVASWLDEEPNGESWREYLLLDALREEVTSGGRRVSVAERVLKRLRATAPGLEKDEFQQFEAQLEDWVNQQLAVPLEELPALADVAKGEVRGITAAELSLKKREMLDNLDTLKTFLRNHGAAGQKWVDFLELGDLTSRLAEEQPDANRLFEIWKLFEGDQPALAREPFTDVANSLQRYIEYLDAANNPQFIEQMQDSVGSIAEQLQSFIQDPLSVDMNLLGQRVGQLARFGQADALVGAIRSHFGNPNVVLKASEGLLTAGMGRNVNETAPVTDVILGTRIEGTGRTTGNLEIALVPNSARGEFQLRMTGTTRSNTVGRNGPAVIYSNGVTRSIAVKRLFLDRNGLSSLPARASATTRSQVRGVGATRGGLVGGIVQREASQRAAQSRPQADRIAAEHAEDRIERRMDVRTGQQVAEFNERFRRRFRTPLEQYDAFPQRLNFSTSYDDVQIVAVQAGPQQLATASSAPELSDTADMSARLHESAINNTAQLMLAGRTMREEEVREAVEEMTGEVPEKLQPDVDSEPWTITFERQQPITVAFFDGKLRLTLRGRSFGSGDRSIQRMEVTATYRLETGNGGILATREGELQILPSEIARGSRRALSIDEAALVTKLRRRFETVLEPVIESEGLELAGQMKEAGTLRLVQVDSQDGWLSLDWNRDG